MGSHIDRLISCGCALLVLGVSPVSGLLLLLLLLLILLYVVLPCSLIVSIFTFSQCLPVQVSYRVSSEFQVGDREISIP